MVLFAFTTLLGNIYYVDQCIVYLLKRTPGKVFKRVYYVLAAFVIFVGAILSADLLWNIADITMGAMTVINIPVILILSKFAFRALENYETQRKEGKEPVFHSKDIGMDNVECWK